MVFARQSKETRCVSRPLRSSVYSWGRGPAALSVPWLMRLARPSSEYTPLPFQFSVSWWLRFACSSRSTTSAIVEPLRFSSYSISTRSGGSACAQAEPASARLTGSQNQLRIVALDVDHPVAEGQPALEEPA